MNQVEEIFKGTLDYINGFPLHIKKYDLREGVLTLLPETVPYEKKEYIIYPKLQTIVKNEHVLWSSHLVDIEGIRIVITEEFLFQPKGLIIQKPRKGFISWLTGCNAPIVEGIKEIASRKYRRIVRVLNHPELVYRSHYDFKPEDDKYPYIINLKGVDLC